MKKLNFAPGDIHSCHHDNEGVVTAQLSLVMKLRSDGVNCVVNFSKLIFAPGDIM